MRVLVLGAGAVGGYFGGRLLEAGRDVSFLVRARRAEQLRKTGLIIRSPLGDARLENPVVLTENPGGYFDLVLLTCKAYDLEPAMQSIASMVGPGTAILPLLNGMADLDALDRRFGAERVLGLKALRRLIVRNRIHRTDQTRFAFCIGL